MSDLAAIIRRLSRPLDPQPTGVEPKLPAIEGIRAVVFDVYGTLLVSGSGDISLTSGASRGESALEALQSVVGEPGASATGAGGDSVVESLLAKIKAAHAHSDHEYPEVEIRDIWRAVTLELGLNIDEAQIEQLAVEYECRVNPIWPMPGLSETLDGLVRARIPHGIVSNAQFFTPIALEYFLGGPLRSDSFDGRLCVWSYAHRRAKPGRFLYDEAARALAEQGIEPGQTLYVGNDMLNDIWPAHEVGFRTVLFAGDARSLRLREGDPRVAGLEPDAVVTDLRQVLTILSLAAG